jgi:hypothetical protein
MTTSATRNRLKYAATLLGAMAFLALAPATAQALPVDQTGSGTGCTYIDADGYPIPIDDGQSVIVDGKTVTCSGGTITTTPAPKKNVGNIRGSVVKGGTLPVLVAQP